MRDDKADGGLLRLMFLGITLANDQNPAHELLTGFVQCSHDRRFKAIEGSAAKSQLEAIAPFADANPTRHAVLLPT